MDGMNTLKKTNNDEHRVLTQNENIALFFSYVFMCERHGIVMQAKKTKTEYLRTFIINGVCKTFVTTSTTVQSNDPPARFSIIFNVKGLV